MATFGERLLTHVQKHPGMSDRELTDVLLGKGKHSSQVNQEARLLEGRGKITRRRRADGLLGNYPANDVGIGTASPAKPEIVRTSERLSEDELKESLEGWLTAEGWKSRIAWGKARGVDIEATRDGVRWLIEVKGLGSRPEMRVNYFIAILGETLQRMDDANAKHSIALPDVPQFRGLWERLPELARRRTAITALFLSPDGGVVEEA